MVSFEFDKHGSPWKMKTTCDALTKMELSHLILLFLLSNCLQYTAKGKETSSGELIHLLINLILYWVF